MTETLSVAVERDIPFPPEKIWRALTQPHLIQEWLMKNDFAPVIGHQFKLRGDWGGVLDCEVLAIEPNKSLSYTWNHAHSDAAFNLQSVVTFTLTPTRAGTLRSPGSPLCRATDSVPVTVTTCRGVRTSPRGDARNPVPEAFGCPVAGSDTVT